MDDAKFQAKVMTPRMLAERWQCSERHVRNMISKRLIPAFKVGDKLVRIRIEDIQAFEAGRQQMDQKY
jgi:excisionase family DNA binding protein